MATPAAQSPAADTGREVLDALADIGRADEPSQAQLDRFSDAIEAHPGQKRTTPLPKGRPSRNRRP